MSSLFVKTESWERYCRGTLFYSCAPTWLRCNFESSLPFSNTESDCNFWRAFQCKFSSVRIWVDASCAHGVRLFAESECRGCRNRQCSSCSRCVWIRESDCENSGQFDQRTCSTRPWQVTQIFQPICYYATKVEHHCAQCNDIHSNTHLQWFHPMQPHYFIWI